MSIFTGPSLLLFLVILELALLRLVKKEQIPWSEVVMNLNAGHILLWVFRGFQLLIYHYVEQHFGFSIVSEWSGFLQFLFVLFAWDLLYYWSHFMHHKWRFLWTVHEVHHQAEHYNISLGIRNSWYSSLTSLPFFLPLAFLGVSVEMFLLVSSIHYFVQFYNHTTLVKNSGWLEYFMITPATHKVHHGKNPEYIDKNCGGTFNIWDKLFGTFQREIKDVPIDCGVHEKIESNNPFWINNLPILKYLGWSKMEKKTSKKQFEISDFALSIGGFILFGWLLMYIYYEKEWSILQLFILFFGVFISTISLGGLFERKLWAAMLWSLFGLLLNWIFIAYFQLYEPLVIFLFGIQSLHSIYVLSCLVQSKERCLNKL